MVKIFDTEEELAEVIALEMQEQLKAKENPVFCLASGSTPAKIYQKFAAYCAGNRDIQKVKFVSLDEWAGVDETTQGSCYQMLDKDLFQHLQLNREQIIFFKTLGCDLRKECGRIDSFIQKNPITFSLMGVGMNGHIGLNEPGSPVRNTSSIVPLSETTQRVAQKYFVEEVYLKEGITIGLQQVIDSERVIVVLTGSHKREITKEILRNSKAGLPAQALLGYEHIDFFLDSKAAELLDNQYKEFNKWKII